MFVICIKLYVLWISSSVRLSSCEIMCLSRLLRARRFVVGCNMEFDWVMGWVGLWVQSFHFAMGRVGLKKLDVWTTLHGLSLSTSPALAETGFVHWYWQILTPSSHRIVRVESITKNLSQVITFLQLCQIWYKFITRDKGYCAKLAGKWVKYNENYLFAGYGDDGFRP